MLQSPALFHCLHDEGIDSFDERYLLILIMSHEELDVCDFMLQFNTTFNWQKYCMKTLLEEIGGIWRFSVEIQEN